MNCLKICKKRESKLEPIQPKVEIVENSNEVRPCLEVERALFNTQILEKIFTYLDHKSLKNCRLVCLKWSQEGALKFPNAFLQVRRTKVVDSELPTLSTFLTKNKIKHTLKPCFFDFDLCYEDFEITIEGIEWKLFRKWRSHCAQRKAFLSKFYAQSNKFTPDIEKYLLDTSHLIVELWLEIHFLKKGDAAIFAGVVSKLKNLKKLALDITNYNDKEIQMIPLDCIPTSVKIIGLRVHGVTPGKPKNLTTDSYINLMRVFINMQVLDLQSWESQIDPDETHCKVMSCVKAITKMIEDGENFPNLCGFRNCVCKSCEMSALLDICFSSIPIRYLSIPRFYYWDEDSSVQKVWEVLICKFETLEFLDFFWIPGKVELVVEEHLKSTFDSLCLNSLKYLGFMSQCYLAQKGTKITVDLMDIFDLRKLFLGYQESISGMDFALQYLTNLCVLFPYEDGEEIWEYIFPDRTSGGELVNIEQIICLSISFKGECDSPQIKRICKMFPCLRFFRHTKPQDKGVICCEHELPRLQEEEKVIIRTLGDVIEKHEKNPQCITYAEKMRYYMRPKMNDYFVNW